MVPASPGPDARTLIAEHERSVPAEQRRRSGVHYTPPDVAGGVLSEALAALGGLPERACDPTCGGGAFLVSLADRLLAAGVPPDEVVRARLTGCEVDPEAVRVARAALSRWARDHGAQVGADEVRVHHRDALATAPEVWPDRPTAGFDLVIGNPPFLSQLSQRTARGADERSAAAARFGPMGAYADGAGLFLLAAVDLVAPGGVVAMLQPQSLLSARDAGAVRARLLLDADLLALWACGGAPFPDADVHVCAPVLRRIAPAAQPVGRTDGVRVVWRHDTPGAADHTSVATTPAAAASWGPLLGPALGVPAVDAGSAPTVGSVAAATAGFRDEFYALCGALGPEGAEGMPQLVTVGMIDPVQLRWGRAAHRVGGRSVHAPTVDLDALGAASPRVAGWVRDRLRPKVLVATQTKVVEAVPDPAGTLVPMTPTISVEPLGDAIDVWHLTAALSAPPVAAAAVLGHLGAGRSSDSLRWSARSLLDAALPVVRDRWDEGADLVRRIWALDADGNAADAGRVHGPVHGSRHELLDRLGAVMAEAHGLAPDDPVVAWWSQRRPRR